MDRVKLDERLRGLFPGVSGRTVKHWLEGGRIRVGGVIVRRGDVDIARGDRVELGTPQASFPPLLRLVFEDDEILVIDKPPGLLTIGTERERERTAYRLLAEYVGAHGSSTTAARRGGPRLFIVHRLDRETSGLLVFAKSVAAKRRLQSQFEARAIERRYVAVVEGAVRENEGTLRSRLREDRSLRVRRARGRSEGREAITHYRVLQSGPATTLLELSLVTGRRGQIRAQLAELGHPIVGDRASGARHDSLRRVCLHATRLGFIHPRGSTVVFESPAPPGFARLVARSGSADARMTR
ncbi:MAG TPA: RluA family pseudouridine synthase [Candidatus Acidoferrum sp.]|nr:RluA family pseudouridine synthase [Candidatus Acidoferrum sp.]